MIYQTHFFVGKGGYDIDTALRHSRNVPCAIPRTIELSGEFTLSEPICLDGRDDGLTLTGGKITGGAELTQWETDPLDARFIRAKLAKGIAPRTLIINGSAKKMSVYHSDSMLECLDRPENLTWLGSVAGGWNRALTEYEMTHMHVKPEDVPPGFLPGSTEVKLYHCWDESTVPVSTYDPENGEIGFESELGHPAGSFNRYNYQFLNLRDGMTEPGTWYADLDDGWVYYYPEEADGDSFTGIIPAANTLIRIDGGANITLSDIELSFSGAERVISGLRSINLNGAIEVWDSKNISLLNLNIHDCSGNGIKVMNSENSEISCCRITSMGAGGIFTHNCVDERICFNHICDIGLSAYSSIGIHAGGRSMLVWVLDGKPREHGRTELRGNRIERVPYCGITCNGGPHIIEGNVLADCMMKLNDGGAIYVSRGERTILRKNRAVGSYIGRQKKAYYFDEGGHECLFEGNESFGIETAYGDHLCEKMVIRKNHFECDGDFMFSFSACKDYEIYENVIAAGNKIKIEVELEEPAADKSADYIRQYLDDHFRFYDNIIIAKEENAFVTAYDEKFEYNIEKEGAANGKTED